MLAVAASAFSFIATPARADTISIDSNFNGTNIADTSFIWFNSHFTAIGGTGDRTIFVKNQTITIVDNTDGTRVVNVPDAQIFISSSVGTASTTFNTATNTWMTSASSAAGNPFMAGLTYDVPVGFNPAGANPVTWSGDFTSSQPGISVSWQWAAAVYTTFSTNYNSLGVRPIDASGEQSGTPTNFESFVIGGARGGGGSNFTGSNSGTGTGTTGTPTGGPEVPLPSTALGGAAIFGVLAGSQFTRRRKSTAP
jgi:hypothetical protein